MSLRKLLFFGELPPATVNGVANANNINIKILKSIFHVDVVEEYNSFELHNKLASEKFVSTFHNLAAILSKSYHNKYSYFYLVFSLSTFGGLKTLLAIVSYRIFNRGKLIIHIHRSDFFIKFYPSFINRIITKLIFSFSPEIVVLSENQKKEMVEKFNISCHVLHNTIEQDYTFEKEKKSDKDFVFVSNYILEKGIIDLLDVFTGLARQYPHFRLYTYGTFSDKKLKEQVLSYASSNICINETIRGEDKFKRIAQSCCLILPSWNEGQPIVLLEAMSVGTPVIATKVGLIPGLLGNDYPYLVDAKNRKLLKETILEFIKSENKEFLSIELKERFNKSYSISQHTLDVKKIFV